MNLQTVKARARWVADPMLTGRPFWCVKHPLSNLTIFTDLPHDAAVEMIRDYVLPRHVELARAREGA